MPTPLHRKIILICLLFIGITECNNSSEADQDQLFPSTTEAATSMDSTILIPVGSFSSDYFPCMDCHSEMVPNPQRRQLVEMHDDIVFDHDSENRWCLACHYIYNRDSLVLADGKRLGFDESYKLCGQCHGPKYRDWKLGIHGKRTGEWNGQKQYYLCVTCHDPHSPKFKPLQPMPPPERPEQIKIDSTYERSKTDTTST